MERDVMERRHRARTGDQRGSMAARASDLGELMLAENGGHRDRASRRRGQKSHEVREFLNTLAVVVQALRRREFQELTATLGRNRLSSQLSRRAERGHPAREPALARRSAVSPLGIRVVGLPMVYNKDQTPFVQSSPRADPW